MYTVPQASRIYSQPGADGRISPTSERPWRLHCRSPGFSRKPARRFTADNASPGPGHGGLDAPATGSAPPTLKRLADFRLKPGLRRKPDYHLPYATDMHQGGSSMASVVGGPRLAFTLQRASWRFGQIIVPHEWFGAPGGPETSHRIPGTIH